MYYFVKVTKLIIYILILLYFKILFLDYFKKFIKYSYELIKSYHCYEFLLQISAHACLCVCVKTFVTRSWIFIRVNVVLILKFVDRLLQISQS